MKLKNKVAIITGGSSGIGKATALLFAKEGAQVVIAGIDETKGKEAVKEIGDSAIFVKCDVTNSNDVKKMIDKTVKTFGKIDILFNNAGVYQEDKYVHELPEELWDEIIDTNLKGVFLCSKYAIQIMKKKGGAIINNASSLGLVAEAESPAYCASKAAVIHLTKVMALEYARDGIRVNCVCPGPIDTPMFRKSFKNKKEAENYIKNRTITGRIGKPEEVAKVVMFLAADDASFVTGSAYSVDGGESLV